MVFAAVFQEKPWMQGNQAALAKSSRSEIYAIDC
jgi:hypothetical protein